MTEPLPSSGDLPAHQHRTVHRHICPVSTLRALGCPHAPSHCAELRRGSRIGLGTVWRSGAVHQRSVGAMGVGRLGDSLLFIYLFQLIARTTQTLGLTVTSIASKLSMVLPVALFLAFDPLDALTWKKAWPLHSPSPPSSWLHGKRRTVGAERRSALGGAVGHFVGSGCIDLMFAASRGMPTCNPLNIGICSLPCP